MRSLVYGTPHLVEESAAVARYTDIFIHERRTRVSIEMVSDLEVKRQRGRIAWADDLFGGMAVSIASIHPPARVVIAATLAYDFSNVGTLTALVACAPEKYGRLVAVAQYHAAHTLLIHWCEAFVGADIFGRMCLYACFVDDVESVAGGILQVARYRRVVAGANGVEAKLLEDGHVLFDKLVIHAVSVVGILHV